MKCRWQVDANIWNGLFLDECLMKGSVIGWQMNENHTIGVRMKIV